MDDHTHDTITSDNHFVIIPNWILLADISDGALRLYGVLRKYADNNTGTAFPSRATLAKDMHKSRDSIDRYVKELIEVGALAVTRRKKAGTYANQVNLYTLVSTSPTDMAAPVRLGSRKDAAREPQGCGTELEPLNYTKELDPPLDAIDPRINANALPSFSDENAAQRDSHSIESKLGISSQDKAKILDTIVDFYLRGSEDYYENLADYVETVTGVWVGDAIINKRWGDRLFEIIRNSPQGVRYGASSWLSQLLNWVEVN